MKWKQVNLNHWEDLISELL